MYLYKKPGEEPVEIPGRLDTKRMEELMGGPVDEMIVSIGIKLWYNKEGKERKYPPNLLLTNNQWEVVDVLYGPVLFTGYTMCGPAMLSEDDKKTIDYKLENAVYYEMDGFTFNAQYFMLYRERPD